MEALPDLTKLGEHGGVRALVHFPPLGWPEWPLGVQLQDRQVLLQERLGRGWQLFAYRDGIRLWAADNAERLWPGLCADAAAQFFLALCHAHEVDVPLNSLESLRLLHLAADQGFAPAQTQLALHFEEGREVKQNTDEALRWYTRSAEAGFVLAQAVCD